MMGNNPEEKPLLMEEEREAADNNGRSKPLIDHPTTQPPRRRQKQIFLIQLLASLYLWTTLPLGILFSFLIQCFATLLLWPVFWYKPSVKVHLLGWLFRTSVTCTAFFMNPFWRFKRVRKSSARLDGRTLVMCNHTTQADPWIFARGLFPREFKWVYKADLLRMPIVGQVLKMANDVPLHFSKDRGGWGTDRAEVQRMMDRVHELGETYDMGTVVFPEGTRSKTGRIQPFKDGFFRFAIEKQWTILPCVAHNSTALWPLGSTLFGYGTVYFSTGEPIKAFEGETSTSLKFRVREAMISLLSEMPLYDPVLDEPYPHDIELNLERGHGFLGAKV